MACLQYIGFYSLTKEIRRLTNITVEVKFLFFKLIKG